MDNKQLESVSIFDELPEAQQLFVIYNNNPKVMTFEEIFDSKKDEEARIISYVSSPKYFSKIVEKFERGRGSCEFARVSDKSENEPRGVDSLWRHDCGDLIGDLNEDSFIKKYLGYEAEGVCASIMFGETEVHVGVLPGKGLLRLVYPETFPAEKAENLAKFVEEICNGIAEEK